MAQPPEPLDKSKAAAKYGPWAVIAGASDGTGEGFALAERVATYFRRDIELFGYAFDEPERIPSTVEPREPILHQRA